MKNILARGGIEFLAVLYGITISIWVDDSRPNSDIEKKDYWWLQNYTIRDCAWYWKHR